MTRPPDPLVATPLRRMLRPAIGPLLPYLLHLRPAEWPIMALHTGLGWLLAAGLAWPDGRAWLGIAAWVVGLNGGTLALNSAFDRDEGDIAYLRQPPPPPRGLAVLGALLMAGGLALTWSFGATWRWLYLGCLAMSVAYSVPPLRLKRVGGLDWLINMVGFGALTLWAGWTLSGSPITPVGVLIVAAFGALFGALYPLTQLYQIDEDRARGDRTLVIRLGVTQSLGISLVAVGVAFGLLGGAAWAGGLADPPLLRWSPLGLALIAWLVILLPWQRTGAGWSSREHQRGMYHALAAWLLTDVAVLLAWVA